MDFVKRIKISDLMRINPHFRRSVQVELDYKDPRSTTGYIATEFVVLHQILLDDIPEDAPETARTLKETGKAIRRK